MLFPTVLPTEKQQTLNLAAPSSRPKPNAVYHPPSALISDKTNHTHYVIFLASLDLTFIYKKKKVSWILPKSCLL